MNYRLWISLLIPEQQDKVISGLVQKGLGVKALSRENRTMSITSDAISGLLALRLENPDIFKVDKNSKDSANQTIVCQIYDWLSNELLKKENIKFFCMIVQEENGYCARWGSGNVKETEKPKIVLTGSPYRDPPSKQN